MIGTSGKRMLGLTARHADSWNVWFKAFDNKVEKLREVMKSVDAACEEAGRDPASLERTAAVKIATGPHAPSTMSVDPIEGSPEEIADALRAFAAIRMKHLQVWLEPNTVAGIEAFAPVLDILDRG